MNTGTKQLDLIINRYGVSQFSVNNEFQRSFLLFHSDSRIPSLHLPYCFWIKLEELEVGDALTYHTFYLPFRSQRTRLAAFLVDHSGKVVERVFYQKCSRYQNASRVIEKILGNQLTIAA